MSTELRGLRMFELADEDLASAWARVGVDISVPSIARVYDALLGGRDNFAVDRDMAAQLERSNPGVAECARVYRRMQARGVRYMAQELGITQFIDIGSGVPTAPNPHDVAQSVSPAARVVYVDSDPVVLAHTRSILYNTPGTAVAAADAGDPEAVLGAPELTRVIDMRRPVGIILLATVHHVAGDRDTKQIVQGYVDALPSGGCLFFSHFCSAPELASLEAELVGMGPGHFRSPEEIAVFFDGLELVEPGLVHGPYWRPDDPVEEPLPVVQRCVLAGVGRKP